MFQNILVGVDGSDHGRDAIALARWLSSGSTKITLAHVHPGGLNPRHAIEPTVVDSEEEGSESMLERERSAAGIEAELVSVTASTPGAGLHGQAEDQHADLIVVGSCRHSGIGRVMLGDNARAALNGAPCAVALAPSGFAAGGEHKGVIGVAYNESPEATHAVEVARELAAERGSRVVALEVVAVPTYAYTEVAAADSGVGIESLLEGARQRLAKLDGVEGRAEFGLAGEQLAAFGDELDLLLVGSRGNGPLKRMILGSTSDYLQRHARCALLVLTRQGE